MLEGMVNTFIFIMIILFIVVIILAVMYFVYLEHNTQIEDNKEEVDSMKALITSMDASVKANQASLKKKLDAATTGTAGTTTAGSYLPLDDFNKYKVLQDESDLKTKVEELDQEFKMTMTKDGKPQLQYCVKSTIGGQNAEVVKTAMKQQCMTNTQFQNQFVSDTTGTQLDEFCTNMSTNMTSAASAGTGGQNCYDLMFAGDVDDQDFNRYGIVVDFLPLYGNSDNLSLITFKSQES